MLQKKKKMLLLIAAGMLALTGCQKNTAVVSDETVSAETDTEETTAEADTDTTEEPEIGEPVSVEELVLEDGTYQIEVLLEGGSGRASVDSPAVLTVQDGICTAQIVWSSPYYDYMLIGEEKYLPVSVEESSVFEIPVSVFDDPMEVTADTTAMSEPHEIDYTLLFYASTLEKTE